MDTGIARALPGHGHTRDPGPDLAGTLVWSLKRALPGLSRGGVCVETGSSPGGGERKQKNTGEAFASPCVSVLWTDQFLQSGHPLYHIVYLFVYLVFSVFTCSSRALSESSWHFPDHATLLFESTYP